MKFPKATTIFELETWLGDKDKIKVTTNEDYYITINKSIRNLEVVLKYDGPIVAPIQKGEEIASLIVSSKGEIIKELPFMLQKI